MAPVKTKHHHHGHRRSHREEAQEPILPSDVTETVQEIKDGLKVMLDDSVKRVKGVADRVEHQYVTPLANAIGSFASSNPVIFTFLSFFTIFSAIPVLIAIGVITFFLSVLLGTLFSVFFAVTAGILLVAGFILTPILAFTAFMSFLATSSLVGLFLASRLYVCINKAGLSNISGGILDWIEETRLRVFLGLGLSAGGTSSHKGPFDARGETLVVARVITTANRENDEREEDERTRVGNQDSPAQVMLELVEVHSSVPVSEISVLQDRIDSNVKPTSTASSNPIQGSFATSTKAGLLDKDTESKIAQEAGA